MYRPSHFAENDPAAIRAFMLAHPFVTLTCSDGGRVAMTQVPVVVEERGEQLLLRGHIMKKTDHHKALERNPEALVLFTGAHCYVSASWYSERGMGGSWNYISVQARGPVRLMGEEDTLKVLTELTHRFEDGQARPELVENMTDAYIQGHIKAIAGFEMQVDSMEATFKLSQNRDDESFKNVVVQLRRTDDTDAHKIAAMMEKGRPHLFS